MGLTLELDDEPDDGIWEDHLPAWQAWCSVSGQLRATGLSGMGGAALVWHGLDYAGAKAGFELAGIETTPELWEEVRTIESGAIGEMNRGRP